MNFPRYLKSYDPKEVDIKEVDLVVVGSGLAGLYTALKAGERRIVVITKEKTEDSTTGYAQGGVAAVLSDEDSPQLHIRDTLAAGADLCYDEAVKTLVEEGPSRVRELIALGTDFDRIEGNLDLGWEGAHSQPRILHAHGDATGEEIRKALVRTILHLDWIDIYEDTFALDLVTGPQGECAGVIAYDRPQKRLTYFASPVTIIASGGCGQVYSQTSNPGVSTGDGMSMGYRAGAALMDMEFFQFHPTTLYKPGEPTFLISEAVRGEGGVLRNKSGQRFMLDYHPNAELASRDVVSRAILTEMRKDNMPHVWLDVTQLDCKFIKRRFPRICEKCSEYGYDISNELIPVVPAAHYIIGGIKTDINGATSMPGLYSCGEAAATGVHGANRLASNALLEGLVFGWRIAQLLADNDFPRPKVEEMEKMFLQEENLGDDEELIKVREKVQEIMMEKVSIVRDLRGLQEALKEIVKLNDYLNRSYSKPSSWETQNIIVVAYSIIKAAIMREESRGCHFRTDFPEKNPLWEKKHIVLEKGFEEGKIIDLS